MILTTAYLTYAFGQATLAMLTFRLWKREKTATAMALLLPMATVVYDNVMIAAGSFIGEGSLLEILTVPRFAGHALFTPLWIVGAVGLALRYGAFASKKRAASIVAWIIYGAMVVIGLLNEVVYFKGEFVAEGDVSFYTNVGRLFTPPPPSLTMLLVVLVCGLIIWKRARWPWMLVGAVGVLLAQFIRGGEAAFVIINSAEVLMSATLFATLVNVRNLEATEAESTRLAEIIERSLDAEVSTGDGAPEQEA